MVPVIIPYKPRTKKSPTNEETKEEKRESGCLYEKRKTDTGTDDSPVFSIRPLFTALD